MIPLADRRADAKPVRVPKDAMMSIASRASSWRALKTVIRTMVAAISVIRMVPKILLNFFSFIAMVE